MKTGPEENKLVKVSVVIPTYKRSEFLIRALGSVLEQTWKEIEAVIVDDNGADSPYRKDTQKLLEPWQADPRIRIVLNEKNLGGALARNEGIKACTGEYVTFLDDDDVFLPQKVEVQVTAMMENGWDMSFMDCDVSDMKGDIVDRRRHPDVDEHPDNEKLLISHLVDPLTPTDTYMYRAEILRRIGMFDDVLTAQEYLLMLKTITSGAKIGYIRQSLVMQYIHDGERMSFGKNKVTGETYLLSVKKKYFHLLTGKQRRFIVCRHHAVLFFATLKRHEYAQALKHMALAALTDPVTSARLFLDKVSMLKVKSPKA